VCLYVDDPLGKQDCSGSDPASLVGCVRFARPQQHAIVAPPLSATKQRGYNVVLTANIIWAPLKQEGMQQAKQKNNCPYDCDPVTHGNLRVL
jgi:hypothetical protein